MKIILTDGKGFEVTHLVNKITEEDFNLIGKSQEIMTSFCSKL